MPLGPSSRRGRKALLALSVALGQLDRLGWTEDALLRLGFSPSDEGWRWKGAVEEAEIKLEFLCELDDQAERSVFQPPGCKRFGALSLRGTGFVSQDYVLRPVTGRLRDGAEVTVEVAFADVGGFLLAKAVALRERAAEKDYHDFVYVLLFNRLGGPAAAARAIRARGRPTNWSDSRWKAADSREAREANRIVSSRDCGARCSLQSCQGNEPCLDSKSRAGASPCVAVPSIAVMNGASVTSARHASLPRRPRAR